MPQKLNRQVNEIANCMGITNKNMLKNTIKKRRLTKRIQIILPIKRCWTLELKTFESC
jgi:hypothetical protein